MDGITITLIQAGSMVSTVAFMFSTGLETRKVDVWYLGSQRGLLFRSFLAVDVLVPLITVSVINLVRPGMATTVGLLLLAGAPIAPMILRKTLQAGGSREYAISLHLVLACLAIVTTPITIEILFGAAGLQREVSPVAIAQLVGSTILIPMIAGNIIGKLFTRLSQLIIRPLRALSVVTSAIVNIVVLFTTYELLLKLDICSYVAIGFMIAGSICAGHLMARGRPGEQSTLALESGSRNIDLTLLMASTFITLDRALQVIIPYIVILAIINTIYIIYQKRARHRLEGDRQSDQG